ncbi:MAG: tripartite tricarboxylate transporter substrate binding protein [Betaproteobacteria bacterium]
MKKILAPLVAAVSLAALLMTPLAAMAQAYPVKPIIIVNPFGAGGALDQLARNLAQKMTESMGQNVLVENRTGAGGNIGADFVAKSAPDGYILVMGSSATHGINPSLYGTRMPFDAIKDFTPVSVSVVQKNVLVVNAAVPANSVKELIALGKAQPGKLSFGSAGTGTSQHLSGELFKSLAGIDMIHIPYKGSAAAMTDLLGGQITMSFVDIPTAITHIKAGKLRALAVTSAQPSPALPDVLPLAQQGLATFDLKAWYGVLAPANTPRAIVLKLNAEITKALTSPDLRDKLLGMGMEPIALTPEQSGVYISAEIDRWAQVIRLSGARID